MNTIVEIGEMCLMGKESELWKSIEKKYAGELASASWFKKQCIKFEMEREFHRRRQEAHQPPLW